MRFCLALALCLLLVGCTASESLAQINAQLVIKEGDALGGSTVASLNAPFTNGLGQVGFVAVLDDSDRSIWFNDGEIFNSSDAAPDTLTGGEGTMGIGDSGQFIYSPSFNGADSVYGQSGLILEENTQAPGFSPGINSTFHSRPQMTDDGTAYWVSGFNDGAGGTSSIGRMLYKRNPDSSIEVFIRAGDSIGGLTVSQGSGVDFDFHFSGDNSNNITGVNLDTGSTADDGRVLVNKTVVAAEGAANGSGDNWDNFDIVSINNSGNYVFSGDTDGATTTDEFIAFNSVIQLREDDMLAGGTLDGSVDALSINNLGQAAFIWDLDSGAGDVETLFISADASDLTNSMVLAQVGDLVDVDNDGVGDWTLLDFNASAGIGPGIDLAENGLVYVEVDLESLDGSTEVEAIIGFAIPEPSTAGIVGLGFVLCGALRRRRRF